jgi:hypothetical protein
MNIKLFNDYIQLQSIITEEAKVFGLRFINELIASDLPLPEDIFDLYINRFDAKYIEEKMVKIRYAKDVLHVTSTLDIFAKINDLNIEYEVRNFYDGSKINITISRLYFISDNVEGLIKHYQDQWNEFNSTLITNEYILNRKKLINLLNNVEEHKLIKVQIGDMVYSLFNSFEEDEDGNVVMKIIPNSEKNSIFTTTT